VSALGAKRTRISPIAWAIAPAALLFVLFFILPFGVMMLLSFLSGNPVSNPNVTFTGRHYSRLFDSDLYFDALFTLSGPALPKLTKSSPSVSRGPLAGIRVSGILPAFGGLAARSHTLKVTSELTFARIIPLGALQAVAILYARRISKRYCPDCGQSGNSCQNDEEHRATHGESPLALNR